MEYPLLLKIYLTKYRVHAAERYGTNFDVFFITLLNLLSIQGFPSCKHKFCKT